jgi:hypothetical protein
MSPSLTGAFAARRPQLARSGAATVRSDLAPVPVRPGHAIVAVDFAHVDTVFLRRL